ncbi:hypothetical protein BASA83_005814 [Batrachochytrium salamandrivorans]|nr:hypothetical protein BASA83_005814 [Batrachochytrium salamandrivorans]
MEPCVQDISDLGKSLPSGPVSTWNLDSIHSDVYPFLDASPDSNSSVPDDIFKEFTSVFSKKQSEKLPIHREFDCTIDLVPNAAPHHGKIYQLTREEDKVMQDWIAENLAKGFIRNSSSPHEMLRTLSIGKVFTTLDLRGAYNLLRIKEGDEPKTAFITKYGQFEFLVMPFGLANAPAQFQRMMNTLFRDSIGKFVLVYLDDIVIYSEDLERHKETSKLCWLSLEQTAFTANSRSVTSTQQEISYLGKVNQRTEKAFSNSSFLAHPCDSKPFILETDASDFAISGVLSQFDDSDQIRPVAFYARQMNSAERNYEIYDKELLAIVDSFKHWRHFLQGGLHPVTVLCDHKSLEYFMSTKKLTRRQARWSLELSEYDFSITHRPGKLNGRADALSRQSDHHLENDCSNFKRILDPKQIIDLQSLSPDMDLHVIVAQRAGEDNVWMDDIPEVTLEKCKKELKNFRFRDDTFLSNLRRWQVLRPLMFIMSSDQRLFGITTNLWLT